MPAPRPTDEPRRTAGVLAPPPLFPLLVIALAEVLRRWRPISLPGLGADAWRVTLSAVVFGASMTLALAAVLTFRKARTPVEPWKPTERIVTAGPFALSRNPIYVAFLGVQLAYAWARPNGWGILLLPLTIGLLHWAVIVREERYLAQRFGDEYQRYRRRVRRWL